jgi:hypothetical protein
VSVGTFLSTGLKLPYTAWFGAEGAGPRHNTPTARIPVRPVPVPMYLAMGAAALINLAIGLQPGPLYDLLPYAVEYDPYTLGKVLEKTQTLLFTGLVFWVLLDRFAAKPKLVLDVDVLYRDLPARLVAARRGRVVPGPDAATVVPPSRDDEAPVAPGGAPLVAAAVAVSSGATATATATLERGSGPDAAAPPTPPPVGGVRALFAVREGIPPVPGTWVLGAVILGAGIVLLLVSLLS